MKKIIILLLFNTYISAQNWSEILKTTSNNIVADEQFGKSVAINDEWAVIGIPYNDFDENGQNEVENAGAVYIYKYNSVTKTWDEFQKIVGTFRNTNDLFGYSVAIYNNTIIVGAPDKAYGWAYVFEYNETYGIWQRISTIEASDGAYEDMFGYSVSVYGNYAVVGAYIDDVLHSDGIHDLTNAGSIYIFKKNTTNGYWEEHQKIVAFDRTYEDEFGISVSIYESTIAVGALKQNSEGAVYIYNKNITTGNWGIFQKIKSDDIAADDNFGYSVSLFDDKIFVGAQGEDEDVNGSNTLGFSGSAYYFWYDSKNTTWIQKQKLTAPIRAIADYYASSLSLYDDKLVVSAIGEDEDENEANAISNSGSVYIYNYNSLTKIWDLQEKGIPSTREENAQFGKSVAINSNTMISGANLEDSSPTITNTGAAYLFEFEVLPSPVELTSFTANVNENSVVLNWQTATEVNNYGFDVETLRATSNEWEKIGFVEGHGNSNSAKDYSFIDNSVQNGVCSYRLKQIDFDGNYEYSDVVEVELALPQDYKLSQNYPNPFNPSTVIEYSIPQNTEYSPQRMLQTKLIVYDILGKEVATLVNESQSAGNYKVEFNASNLSSGVYFYKLESGNFKQIKKLMLIK